MQINNGELRFSATDLVGYLALKLLGELARSPRPGYRI